MLKKIVSGIMLTLLLMCLFTIMFRVKSAKADLELPIVSGSNTVVCVGQVFDFNITINNLDADWKMIGFTFLFMLWQWEPILEILTAKEGSFMQQFPNTLTPPHTIFLATTGPPSPFGIPFAIAGVLLPDDTGNWTIFPEGNGVLATLTFEATEVGIVIIQPYAFDILSNVYDEEIPHEHWEGFIEVREPLPGDLNLDSKVDIKDIAIAASAFGSFPGHPKWNPIADTNQDSRIDIKDLALIAMHFGKTYQ